MPEGPELHLSSLFINRICRDRIFSGKIERNPIHKCAEIDWDEAYYKISAESRGKELKLHLQSVAGNFDVGNDNKPVNEKSKSLDPLSVRKSTSILFTFGMSGKFEWTKATERLKHSHLSFSARTESEGENNAMALSFVDYRRFGKWYQNADWSQDRGPCIIYEFDGFVNNVVNNLNHTAFNKPICEVMLDQRFFSGIGNYLRAEILFRCKVAPFEKASSVLMASEENEKSQKTSTKESSVVSLKERGKDRIKQPVKCVDKNKGSYDIQCPMSIKSELKTDKEWTESNGIQNVQVKEEKANPDDTGTNPDVKFMWNKLSEKGIEILHLCHTVPMEVVQLGSTKYTLSDLYKDANDGSQSFHDWVQCYYQDGMKNLADHNNRTIWFTGPAGPLVPKDQKSRNKKAHKKSSKKSSSDGKAMVESKDSVKSMEKAEKKKSRKWRITREKLKEIKDSEQIHEKGSKRHGRQSNVQECKLKSVSKRKRKVTDVIPPVSSKQGKRRKKDSTEIQTQERKSIRITRSSILINKT